MKTTALREIRLARGLKQTELAKMVGVTQPTIGNYENGTRIIDATKLSILAKVLGVTTDEILGFKPAEIEETKKAVHGNSRTAQIQEVFEKLKPADQRAILKQAKGLIEN